MNKELTLADRLWQLAMNLSWTWQPEVSELFRDIDEELWETTNHNPVAFLKSMSEEEIEKRGSAAYLNTRILYAHRRLEEYLNSDGPLGGVYAGPLNAAPVAYFSAEFGLHECLPIYSGGLGILAGDHLKAASDMGIPLVGVGLLYAEGYFHQYVSPDGWQEEIYETKPRSQLPIAKALDPEGKPVEFTLEMPGAPLQVRVWKAQVGRVPLYLLDTNVEGNSPDDRKLTDRLYGGGPEKRIRQEIVLGVGGIRALKLVGIRPSVLHLNEGHCSFAVLEHTRERMESDGQSFEAAFTETTRQTCFTTHTPVPAGHDRFDAGLMEKYLGWMRERLHLDEHRFMSLGRVSPNDNGELYCMTVLALKGSIKRNAVSCLHGRVSRDMWSSLWPGRPVDEIPIGHVTNGVHVASWMAPVMKRLYERELGRDWDIQLTRPVHKRKGIFDIADGELWETHMLQKLNLVAYVRESLLKQARRQGRNIGSVDNVLDPRHLTIGFSRRFATYKRATMLFENMDTLREIMRNKQQPVQFIFAGKAHPADDGGKRLIQQINKLTEDKDFKGRMVFLEDYDIGMARRLVQGVDVWLNNPARPLEACGTSGMKVAANGGLNLSILDGWWAEAYDCRNGFAIGDDRVHTDSNVQRRRDAEDLYRVLKNEVIPCFYDRDRNDLPQDWVARMKRAMDTLTWRFSAGRMVCDYMNNSYLPAAGAVSVEMK